MAKAGSSYSKARAAATKARGPSNSGTNDNNPTRVVTLRNGTTLTGDAAGAYGDSSSSGTFKSGDGSSYTVKDGQITNSPTGYVSGSAGRAMSPSINSNVIQPANGITLPPTPGVSNTGTQAMTSVGAAATTSGATDPNVATKTSQNADIKAFLKGIAKPADTEDIYQKTLKESGVAQKQQTVNNLTAQLNSIVAQAQADKLSLVGQGRGVTDVIIGGQQAKIDREAAIQSLPISAQLSAAQGDLDSAKDFLNTLFKIRAEDAQAKADYKNKINDAVYNYATEQQKIALDERRRLDDRAFDVSRDNLNYMRQLSEKALDAGQPGLMASISKLDPSDKNFESLVGTYASQIRVPQKSTSGLRFKIGAPEGQLLLGVGYSANEITTLEQGVNDYGFQSVYDAEKSAGATSAQLSALQKVYGVPEKLTRSQIETTVTSKVAYDALKESFTDTELKQLANESGASSWFTGSASDIERYLNSDAAKTKYVDMLYEQYKAAGMVAE